MVVAPSSLGTQPIGEAVPVADSVYQLKLPVPFPLKFVASYLVEGEDGWTVVDPGFDYPPAREAWETEAAKLGLDLDFDIEKVVVTHLHPDHIGLAWWLEERSGTPVYMLGREILNARQVWDPGEGIENFFDFLVRYGMDEEIARPTAGTTNMGIRLPQRLVPLRDGEVIRLGDQEVRVIHTPGHSDFHFVMHDEKRRILYAGDHVLLHITPNIGLWTYTAPRPLERYLDSLRSLRGLEADLILPGHGPLFHDLDGRIDELLEHHGERLDTMHGAFDGEEVSPFDIARRVFSSELTDHQLRFALAETLAHLEYLEGEERAERTDGEVVTFRAR